MESRFRTFALFFAAFVLATGAGRTAHMLVDHAGGGHCHHRVAEVASGCGSHGHAHHEHEHGSGEPDSDGSSPDEHEHGDDPSCDLCVVLSSIASPDAGSPVFVVELPDRVELLVPQRGLHARALERMPRETRGPPSRA